MQTGAWSLPPGTATQITATLYDEDMRVNTDSQRITFSTDRGSVAPADVDTVDGVAAATFTAGAIPGQATIVATTGEVTGTLRIRIEGVTPQLEQHSYLPVLQLGQSGLSAVNVTRDEYLPMVAR